MKSTRARLGRTVSRAFLAILIAGSSLVLFSFTIARTLIDDVWKQFGITQQQATANIKNSFLQGYLDRSGVYNVRNLTIGDRAATAKDVLVYTKTYLNGPDFSKAYQELRTQAKPEQPEAVKRTKEDIRKERVEEMEKSISEMEEAIKKAPNEEMKKIFTESLKGLKDMLKEYKDPNSATIEMLYQGETASGTDAQDRYKEDLANWQTEYPENQKLFIRAKLQKYLAKANTVDFAAATVEKNGKKRFVKEAYEAKDSEWKMIYRAGKDVYDVSKPFAEQWIKEIQ